MSIFDKLKNILTTKPKISFILTGKAITVKVPDRPTPFVMNNSHEKFTELAVAAKENDHEKVNKIIDTASHVQSYVQGKIEIKNGMLFYAGQPVNGTLVNKIIKSMDKGLPSKPFILFFENLMQNPSERAKKELYDFLQATRLPITNDGRFVAYKWVRKDYKDEYSGKNLHTPGCFITMPRGQVNSDSTQTCSSGLHVCGAGYDAFSDKLMLVLVNPKDVVSVPVDYNSNKMRVCAYQVFKEIPKTERWGKEDIIETNEIFFTKLKEPEAPVKKEAAPAVSVEVKAEAPKEEVVVKEVVAVAKAKLNKSKAKAKAKAKSKTKPTAKTKATPVTFKGLDKKTEQVFKDLKNKRGKALICQRYGLTDTQYTQMVIKYKAYINKK